MTRDEIEEQTERLRIECPHLDAEDRDAVVALMADGLWEDGR